MEDLPTPLSRVELYLAKACGMDVTVPEQPLSRLEQFLAILAGDTSITMPAPASLTEQWLAYVLGVTPSPLLAVEGACLIGAQKVDVRYFAVAASMPGATLPEAPQNRAEMYWAHIAGNPPTPGILKYVTGKYFYLTDVVSGIEELQYIKGDTYQQTYSGKNLFDFSTMDMQNVGFTSSDGTVGGANNARLTTVEYLYLPQGTYTLSFTTLDSVWIMAYDTSKTYLGNGYIQSSWDVTNAKTFTVNQDCYIRFSLRYSGGGSIAIKDYSIQVEANSHVTSYEPYTGGIPAPNPDYPQDIDVVTGEQTVTVTGKNLLDSLHGFANKYINDSGGESNGGGNNALFGYIAVKPEITYTLSQKSDSLRLRNYGFAYYDANKTFLSRATYDLQTTQTITTPSNCSFIRIWVANSQTGVSQAIIEQSQLQFEQGSTATAYEPYQVQSYTVDLGATELCKIGNYQDYIYKSGDDWYVHKLIEKLVANGSEDWTRNGNNRQDLEMPNAVAGSESDNPVISTRYVSRFSVTVNNSVFLSAYHRLCVYDTAHANNTEVWKTWLASNNITFYYALVTATNTKITDATLISQLNALNSAQLPKPIANITVSATGTNLTPYLTIAYYGSDEE